MKLTKGTGAFVTENFMINTPNLYIYNYIFTIHHPCELGKVSVTCDNQ